MQLVVPMAGLGARFQAAGYTTPKPLISISGKPMVVRVVEDLPPATRLVFIVHPQHVMEHQIDNALESFFPKAKVIIAPGLTQGQACTVHLAASELDPSEDTLVAACDATHLWNEEKWERMRDDDSIDAAAFTYRGDCRVLTKPHSYGWLRVASDDQTVQQISCKTPLRENDPNGLLQDHVVSGFFWFRTAQLMIDAIDETVRANDRVNNEFYMDVVVSRFAQHRAKLNGQRVVAFEVDKYIGWGTPEDVAEFRRWERYFHRRAA